MPHPFLTSFQENPDYSNSDTMAETANLFERQKAIQAFIKGEESADFVLDLLESQAIDPIQYVDEVEDNIEYFLGCHSPPNSDSLLWLPP